MNVFVVFITSGSLVLLAAAACAVVLTFVVSVIVDAVVDAGFGLRNSLIVAGLYGGCGVLAVWVVCVVVTGVAGLFGVMVLS